MRKLGLRRALTAKSVPRQQDPEFVQEDVDEHGRVHATRQKPQRSDSLLKRVFRGKKGRHSEDLDTIHSGEVHNVPPPIITNMPASAYGSEHGGHSFAGAGTHLMSEPIHHDYAHEGHSVRDHSVRGHTIPEHSVHEHSMRDHSVRDHSVRDHPIRSHTLRDDHSRGYPEDYVSATAHTRPDLYDRDYRDEHYPNEHVTVVSESRHSHHTAPHTVPRYAPTQYTAPTVVHETRDDRSSSDRSYRSGSRRGKHEVEVNLRPGEKQEFEIGPNTQLIVPDDVELEISDGKGGWLPYHESLLRRPPREEVYVISGGSNFIVEDEMGNVLHRSQPRTYSGAPVSVAGSVAGRSTRSRREPEHVYIDS